MKERDLSASAGNVKKNLWLLVSMIAVLCLFLVPSLLSVICFAAVFAAVVVAAAFDAAKPDPSSIRHIRGISVLLTLLIGYIGFDTFMTTWTQSEKAAALAGSLGMTTPMLLLIVGFVGCTVGVYAMYVLSCWIVSWTVGLMKAHLPVQQKSEMVANLKQNWYFPISAMAFFCLSATLKLGYIIGLLIAFLISVLISSQVSSIWSHTGKHSIVLRVLSMATAVGICSGGQASFYADWSISPKTQALEAMFPIAIDIPGVASVFGAVVAVFFVYVCVLVFWNRIADILRKIEIFGGIKTVEWVVYGFLLALTIILMVFSFAKTQAFYGTELFYDIIYTSDSPTLVKGNVYLALTHPENDLRQPLFAVFAAPFTGIPYLAARLSGASASVQAMLVNAVQIMMLFAANLILAKMMKLDSRKRICFMVLASFVYSQMLFTLMMEQYIVAYFWLIFCMYLIAEKQQPDRIVLWGAGGTLLTSMVLLPFMSDKNPAENFKEWFADMVRFGLEFVAVMLVFCRFDVIFNLTAKVSVLGGFTGRDLTLMDKIYQYISFVASCFVAPDAGVNTTAVDHISWQLDPVTGINFLGVAILVLMIISVILNRDKKSSLLAAGWIGFSVVMLLGLGWGTKENGLILYTQYFGWAFLVLLFQLIEKIENKLNIRFLIPIITVCVTAVLLAINIPAMIQMVDFAIAYYPA